MIIYGKQVLFYVVENHPELIEAIYLAKEVDKKLFAKLARLNKQIIKLDYKKAQGMARGGNHQGFLLEVKDLEFVPFSQIKNSNFLLVLVGVSDVGNIGAIVRSAYALGVDGVIISNVKSANLEGIVRTSTGSALDLPISLVPDVMSLLNELKQLGFELVVADMSGDDVRESAFSNKKVLFVGSEGEGVPNRIIKGCDKVVKIAMNREFDSLNVSVATAILCDRMRD